LNFCFFISVLAGVCGLTSMIVVATEQQINQHQVESGQEIVFQTHPHVECFRNLSMNWNLGKLPSIKEILSSKKSSNPIHFAVVNEPQIYLDLNNYLFNLIIQKIQRIQYPITF
jgi:hypothetical protein